MVSYPFLVIATPCPIGGQDVVARRAQPATDQPPDDACSDSPAMRSAIEHCRISGWQSTRRGMPAASVELRNSVPRYLDRATS